MTALNIQLSNEQNKLVEDNLKLVYYFARKICTNPQSLDDCIQEGCLGLIRAAQYYDESRNVKFSTFAGFEIKCAIRSYLYRNKIIRIPENYSKQINLFKEEVKKAESNLGRTLTQLELKKISNDLNLPDQVVNQITNSTLSLNNTISTSEGDSLEYLQTLPDTEINIENEVEAKELLNVIKDFTKCVNSRNPKYVSIFEDYLGEIIEAALCCDESKKRLLNIVRKYHPEFVALENDSAETVAYKAKRLDSYYQSAREFCIRNIKNLQKYILEAEYI